MDLSPNPGAIFPTPIPQAPWPRVAPVLFELLAVGQRRQLEARDFRHAVDEDHDLMPMVPWPELC